MPVSFHVVRDDRTFSREDSRDLSRPHSHFSSSPLSVLIPYVDVSRRQSTQGMLPAFKFVLIFMPFSFQILRDDRAFSRKDSRDLSRLHSCFSSSPLGVLMHNVNVGWR